MLLCQIFIFIVLIIILEKTKHLPCIKTWNSRRNKYPGLYFLFSRHSTASIKWLYNLRGKKQGGSTVMGIESPLKRVAV